MSIFTNITSNKLLDCEIRKNYNPKYNTTYQPIFVAGENRFLHTIYQPISKISPITSDLIFVVYANPANNFIYISFFDDEIRHYSFECISSSQINVKNKLIYTIDKMNVSVIDANKSEALILKAFGEWQHGKNDEYIMVGTHFKEQPEHFKLHFVVSEFNTHYSKTDLISLC